MEGMRELERIMDKQDVILCALMLLIYAHKKCETVGKLNALLISGSSKNFF